VNPADLTSIHEIYVRLGIAMLMGAVLGIDRDLHRKPAGLRVLSLVCLGACVIVIASVRSFAGYTQVPSNGILPTIQGVLSGIGFLGAGVILHAQGRDEVHGLTTAAAIWMAAILGMTCGLGQLALSTGAFVASWLILVVGRYIEAKVLNTVPPAEYRPTNSNPPGDST
jgi:putative Mg2+ transporter-C (MgtC) family protein